MKQTAWSSSCGNRMSREPSRAAPQAITDDFPRVISGSLKYAATARTAKITKETAFAITASFFMLSASLNSVAPGLCSACGSVFGSRLNFPM